jgi:hypothetical protein
MTLLLPAGVGGGLFLLLRSGLGDWALIPAAVVALGIMALEAALMLDWLGRIFERTDPSSAGITA